MLLCSSPQVSISWGTSTVIQHPVPEKESFMRQSDYKQFQHELNSGHCCEYLFGELDGPQVQDCKHPVLEELKSCTIHLSACRTWESFEAPCRAVGIIAQPWPDFPQYGNGELIGNHVETPSDMTEKVTGWSLGTDPLHIQNTEDYFRVGNVKTTLH